VHIRIGTAAALLLSAAMLSCAARIPTAPDPRAVLHGAGDAGVFADSPGRTLLGYWTIRIPADRSRVQAVPARMAELHLNVVRLLEGKACNDCLELGDFLITSQDVLMVNVTLKHPFPGLAKYTGFDVRGIVITGSDYVFPSTDRRISWTGEHVRLLWPDGYTTLFNPTEFPEDDPGPPALKYIPGHKAPGGDLSATLNPYVCFMKDEERRMFQSGAAETQMMRLKLVPGDLELGYAVDACWTPVDDPVTEPLDDFPITANCREAYAVFVNQAAGLKPIAGTSAIVQVEVRDHQGSGTVSAVVVEAPDLFNGARSLEVSTTTDEGIFFTGTLVNELGAAEGEYPLLTKVIDWEGDENLGQVDAWQVVPVRVTESGYPLNELVCIPEGWFFMGIDEANDPTWEGALYSEPGHMHPTGSYYISRYEVTWREYESFMAAGGYYNPEWWSTDGWAWRLKFNRTYPRVFDAWMKNRDEPDWPATVHYYEAEAFCKWAGGRLPTEPEWERAARGDNDHRVYPWGDEWDPEKLWCKDNSAYHWFMGFMPVGSFSPEGDSPWGLSDCAGNQMELTSYWWTGPPSEMYEQYASGDFTPPPPPEPGEDRNRVTRDGDYGAPVCFFRCAWRWFSPNLDSDSQSHGGFRIVFDNW